MAMLNLYSVSHFFIWFFTGRYLLQHWGVFLALSIGWEALELVLPFEFAVEEWSNKCADVVVNTVGFYLGSRLRTDGLIGQISKTTSQNQPGP
jgi:hypothetical protein